MRTPNVLLLCGAVALLVTVAGSALSVRADELGEREWFEKRVRPLLTRQKLRVLRNMVQSCVSVHSAQLGSSEIATSKIRFRWAVFIIRIRVNWMSRQKH